MVSVFLGCEGLGESMRGSPGGKGTRRGWNRASHGRGSWKELPRKIGHSALHGQYCAVCFVHIISFAVWQGHDHQHFTQGELRNREGKWLGQGHMAGSQYQAAWQNSGGAMVRFQSQLCLRPAVALRDCVPCCKVRVTRHTGVRSKVVVKPVLGLYGLVFNCSGCREHSCGVGETNQLGRV